MIRDIEIRKMLADKVYQSYGGLTNEEKPEYDHEVGAAFMGYETALNKIREMLTYGHSKEDVLWQISNELDPKNFRHLKMNDRALISQIITDMESGNHLLRPRSQEYKDMWNRLIDARDTKPDERTEEQSTLIASFNEMLPPSSAGRKMV